jgi:hypothetical protein
MPFGYLEKEEIRRECTKAEALIKEFPKIDIFY